MSITYTKLFSSITESTIWVEPYATRIVWVSMLAMADRNGRIWASVPGLARRAGVTLEECETALERFQSPDKYSRTPDNDGRRIEPIDGGWRLLNYAKYRAQVDEENRKEYKRDWDRTRRKRPDTENRNPTESDNIRQNRPQPTQAEAEAEAEAEKPKTPTKRSSDNSTTSAVVEVDARASPVEFPKPTDHRVLALHGIAIAAGIRVPLLSVQQWVADGVSEAVLCAAIGKAKAKKPGQTVPLNFLQCFVLELRNGGSGYDAEAVAKAAMAAIAAEEARSATH